METKICMCCKQEFSIENFCKNKNKKDGRNIYCKLCAEIKRKNYRLDNKEKYTEANRLYYKNNKEIILEASRIYEINNKALRSEQHKEYRETNKELLVIKRKLYYENNKEVFTEKARQKWIENKSTITIYNDKYRKGHLEQFRIYSQKRRALETSLPSTFTSRQWEQTKTFFNNRCCYCGHEKPLAQEHFYPVIKGGSYDINNIIPSCKSCNSSKGPKDFDKWYKTFKHYSKKREKIILKYLGYEEKIQQIKII